MEKKEPLKFDWRERRERRKSSVLEMLARTRRAWVVCDGGIQSTQKVTERFESQRRGERRRGEGIEQRRENGCYK